MALGEEISKAIAALRSVGDSMIGIGSTVQIARK